MFLFLTSRERRLGGDVVFGAARKQPSAGCGCLAVEDVFVDWHVLSMKQFFVKCIFAVWALMLCCSRFRPTLTCLVQNALPKPRRI